MTTNDVSDTRISDERLNIEEIVERVAWKLCALENEVWDETDDSFKARYRREAAQMLAPSRIAQALEPFLASRHPQPVNEPADLPEDLRATFPPSLPANWPDVLESRAKAAYLGDSKGTVDLLRATAVYIRQSRTQSPAEWQVEADKIVDELFSDLRDRRFLKWLFKDEEGVIGDFPALRSLDLEVQQEIRSAWAAIISKALRAAPITPPASERSKEETGVKVRNGDGVERSLVEWLKMFRSLTHNTGFLWMAADADKYLTRLSALETPPLPKEGEVFESVPDDRYAAGYSDGYARGQQEAAPVPVPVTITDDWQSHETMPDDNTIIEVRMVEQPERWNSARFRRHHTIELYEWRPAAALSAKPEDQG